MVADCKYIPESRLALVEQALLSLQTRLVTKPTSTRPGTAPRTGRIDASAEEDRADAAFRGDGGFNGGGGARGGTGSAASASGLPPSSMENVDEYLELMYEEGEGKVPRDMKLWWILPRDLLTVEKKCQTILVCQA